MKRTLALLCLLTLIVWRSAPAQALQLKPATTDAGYIARLLINEAPFPGERGWLSEDDTKATMLAILWVLHARIDHIPAGYRQEQIAAVRTRDIIDVITVGGEKGQCDGFYRDAGGTPRAVSRVHERIDYLSGIAGKGGGYMLTRDAADITIDEVIEAAIGPINIVECVLRPETCLQADVCECRSVYQHINNRIADALKSISLAGLAGGEFPGSEKIIDNDEIMGCPARRPSSQESS